MPIYEYQCQDCGEKFEKFVRSMSNPGPEMKWIKCPKCGGQRVEKLLSSFGLRVSGSMSEPICPTCMPRR